MKLYTEEQVRRAINLTLDSPDNSHHVIDHLNPIELPSDEEIRNKSWDYQVLRGERDSKFIHFIEGAKWIREQITKTK